jgi:hypothetical protein
MKNNDCDDHGRAEIHPSPTRAHDRAEPTDLEGDEVDEISAHHSAK